MLSAPAQTAATGTIAGQITDTSGAALPGAVVVIRDTDSGAVHNVVTNSDGVFSVAFLQSGHYEAVASAAGFAQLDHKNLKLTVGQLLTVDSFLPTATVSTDVIVTSEDPLIDTQKVQVSQTVTQEYVANLPVNGRRWDNFVLLTPNVAPDSNSGLISYRGVSGLYNSNLVDGVSNQQALFAEARGRATGAPYVFSPDSIKEFQSAVSGTCLNSAVPPEVRSTRSASPVTTRCMVISSTTSATPASTPWTHTANGRRSTQAGFPHC